MKNGINRFIGCLWGCLVAVLLICSGSANAVQPVDLECPRGFKHPADYCSVFAPRSSVVINNITDAGMSFSCFKNGQTVLTASCLGRGIREHVKTADAENRQRKIIDDTKRNSAELQSRILKK